jgi:hypothetical protein
VSDEQWQQLCAQSDRMSMERFFLREQAKRLITEALWSGRLEALVWNDRVSRFERLLAREWKRMSAHSRERTVQKGLLRRGGAVWKIPRLVGAYRRRPRGRLSPGDSRSRSRPGLFSRIGSSGCPCSRKGSLRLPFAPVEGILRPDRKAADGTGAAQRGNEAFCTSEDNLGTLAQDMGPTAVDDETRAW